MEQSDIIKHNKLLYLIIVSANGDVYVIDCIPCSSRVFCNDIVSLFRIGSTNTPPVESVFREPIIHWRANVSIADLSPYRIIEV